MIFWIYRTYYRWFYNPVFEYYHMNYRYDVLSSYHTGTGSFFKPKWNTSLQSMIWCIMFKNLRNLYRISKLYKLLREIYSTPEIKYSVKHWIKIFKTALSVREVQEMLQGYKTYIIAILTAAVTVLHQLGYIDTATYQSLIGLLGAGAVGTVAAKINRINKKIK